MSCDATLRDPQGRRDPARVADALQQCDVLVDTAPQLGAAVENPTERGTLADALDFATDPRTTKKRPKGSAQPGEWRRAAREARAALPDAIPLTDLSADHVAALARSALARVAAGVDAAVWGRLLDTAADAYPGEERTSDQVLAGAYALAQADGPRPPLERTGKITWPERAVDLVRAMVRHSFGRDKRRFAGGDGFTKPRDLHAQLAEVMNLLGASEAKRPFRPRYEGRAAQKLMRHLADPRYRMWSLLALGTNGRGAYRTPRSWLEVPLHGIARVRVDRGGTLGWHRFNARESDALRALLAGPYAAAEVVRASGRDYRLLHDVRWNGDTLEYAPDGELAPELLDPRTRLLYDLGAEGRGGQILRAMWSDLHELREENGDLADGKQDGGEDGPLLLQVPGAGTKYGPALLLAPSQVAALGFETEVGYLADFERQRRAGQLKDYPLFPQGDLRNGRAQVPGEGAAQPLHKDTGKKWAKKVEAVLGVDHVDGRGQYGWRRIFIDLLDHWHADTRVKNLLTGHERADDPEHGSTRVHVYLNKEDRALLLEVQRLVHHLRTEFARTGTAPPEVAGRTQRVP